MGVVRFALKFLYSFYVLAVLAMFLGYMDAFWVLMLISLSAVPLALALRKVKLGGSVHMGH